MANTDKNMILLKNPLIITMDPGRSILKGRSILIKGNKIECIAKEGYLRKKYKLRKCKIIDCKNKIALPGLINTHTHAAMSVFKGIWHLGWNHIYDLMFPVEKKLSGSDVYQFSRLGILEMLKGGTTCFVDHYYFISEVAKAAKELGLRAVLGHTLMDIEGPHKGMKEFAKALRFADKFSDDPLITPCFAPHATETVSPGYLRRIIKEAFARNALVHMHVAQTRSEYERISKTHSKTPVQYLRDIGALNSRFLAAHCIYLDKKDIDIMAKHKASIVFTPSSEIIFEGLPPIREMIKAKVNLALGTDSVAVADFMSPLHEMKKAFYSIIQANGAKYQLKPIQILEMFTINAAKALGMEHDIGSIEEGKLADILILDALDTSFNPVYDIYSNIVLCSMEAMLDFVIVNGRIVLKNGKPTRTDEMEILKTSIRHSKRLMSRVFKGKKRLNRLMKPWIN
ncbi:amidohydrolase family protein [Elusimicrobiota bacterium]